MLTTFPPNSIDFTDRILPKTTGIYASECGGNPSFNEYRHIDTIRSIVQEQMKEYHFPELRLQEPLESFYATMGTIFVKQMTIYCIVDELIEQHPDLVNLDSSDPSVAKAIYASLDDGRLISYNSQYESLSFHEIHRVTTEILANPDARKKLINGGQTIIDIAAGRGELGLSLLAEIYLKQLEACGDPTRQNRHGFKPNKLILLDNCNYIDDINEAININSPLLNGVLDHNQLQVSISLLQDCIFPDDGFIVGHGLCGTLVDDAIDIFINSNAYMLVGVPCCLSKAENEAPRYNMTNSEWNRLVSTVKYGSSVYTVIDAIHAFDLKRVQALAMDDTIKAHCSCDCLDSKAVIFAVRTDNQAAPEFNKNQ